MQKKTNPRVQKKIVSTYPKNPIVHRGEDPELFWMNKYGSDDTEDEFDVDIRSLYRAEHISPEILIKNFYKMKKYGVSKEQFDMFEMFGNEFVKDELEKVGEYYKHQDDWTNRMILGDSLMVMNSLLEREGMAGQVQMIFIDPPYGIKYGSNWQMKLNSRNVVDGRDEHLTGEPEMIKAYRDTWELGIHSYLSYLRERLIVAKSLLTESGSCFVQIGDENVHLVRCLMDEVFGSENFVSIITFKTATSQNAKRIQRLYDHLLWYSKTETPKFRHIYRERTNYEIENIFNNIDKECNKRFKAAQIDNYSKEEIKNLLNADRLTKNKMYGKRFEDDFIFTELDNVWSGTIISTFSKEKKYVVQTSTITIMRCILMTTDPGDIILDPTCGSGTTAYMAEQWGRRWITVDTSRISLNIAKSRLMTATYPYYKLYDEKGKDLRQGFIYKKVPHITLRSIAKNEPPEEETLFDKPEIDRKRLRVSGPFTVETLQNYNPVSPEDLEQVYDKDDRFIETVFEHLKTSGVKTGIKEEQAVFTRVESLSSPYLNAEGFYEMADGEKKAYIHLGPKFGTVSKLAVNEAVKECRSKGDADWLIILGFSFESDISTQEVTTSLGSFKVTKARMHDDLMQEGLLKRDKKAASFVTIGEPDIKILKSKSSKKKIKDTIQIEIQGLDIYDPIKDEVKARDIKDIAYWMLDDDYDGSNFITKQVFFCGGNEKEINRIKKSLEKLEKTLKIEIDEEAFKRVYDHVSHPIEIRDKNQKIAVKVVSQFGEESMKVVGVE